jgi:hypothetical protein
MIERCREIHELVPFSEASFIKVIGMLEIIPKRDRSRCRSADPTTSPMDHANG